MLCLILLLCYFFLITEIPNVLEISYPTLITIIRKYVFFVYTQSRKSSKFPSRLSP